MQENSSTTRPFMALIPNDNPIPQNPETGGLQREYINKEQFEDLFWDQPYDVPPFNEKSSKARARANLQSLGILPIQNAPFFDKEEEEDQAIIETLTYIRNIPSYLNEFVTKATKDLAVWFNKGAKDAGFDLNYHPSSATRLDGIPTPGVITVAKLKQALIVQGLNILINRVATLELEKIAELKLQVEQAAITFAGKKFIAKAAAKTVFGNIVAAFGKFLTAEAMAKIELQIRDSSFDAIQQMTKAKLDQNRKFSGGATRVTTEVYGRI